MFQTPHGQLRVAAVRDVTRLGIGLYVSIHAPDGKIYKPKVQDLEWEEVTQHGTYAAPMIVVNDDDAPKVAEAFASECFCPSQSQLVTAELRATRARLDDMRELVGINQAGVKRKLQVEL